MYLNPGQTLEDRIQKMQTYLSDNIVPSTWFAEEDGVVLGSAAIIESDMETHPEYTPWMASVFVAPEHRRKGIGSTLVKHVVAETKKTAYKTLYLFTPDQQDLYKSLGWKQLQNENYRGSDVAIMSYDLS
ncbi:MAG: GNAT family N-acetyltransferase [uncultured Thiotrichaceae bacterium]|uniref:GNAT family N-acetyltransferase n=1 Tax=uncultured Thiotrichaceae bacterium TaxID=298394 RepID=A0A6S6TZF5_9GAMM|nr:MAG: GNAT family N-acetyltransferase [uncultured Thiotrichaceae bacterium]